ncbi:DNA integrity scanning diadenylate cyclase DisA [Sporomusa acidovorans]|uniref:DNA integrity scanning protein DisA n=1 Tax=Sporomusa acidovorans (strain ATCC 49682 / DSM 3132 / Mol) TaxID=1123286 RepID=A0ABZ3IWG5_SPOA4|nr:DNA integrity scanning diadenylate cyclase DisA [Sporomusa acidovorans]OZC13874.1 DNA integrity scanning protein DisA [Sporomusa acidovorans DSM 3132]SDF48593.1 diadenylate cyclase [Sporomusa acidovorans]
MSKNREERAERLWDARFVKTIKTLAPGTTLRDGLENVLRAKMGALVLVGDNPAILEIVDGGFEINSDFTPAGFYELAKMDGAIVLSNDSKKILFANAQLVPDPGIPTAETGTRHRTAERAAKQTGAPVVAISQRRNVISVYLGHLRYTLKDISVILNRANQALQTLEKYKKVLDKGLINLSALEFEDLVTLYDVAVVLIRAERVNRIAREIERYIIELGTEGRLISMQMEELISSVDDVALLIKDYCNTNEYKDYEAVREQIAVLPEENLEPFAICRALDYGVGPTAMDIPVVPRGYRILRQIPRLPLLVGEKLVAHFKTLHHIYNASLVELDEVEGIGEVRAKTIKDGLKRLREQAFLDRHY